MRVLFDTNVLLDYLAHRKNHWKNARSAILLVQKNEEAQAFVSAKSILDIHYQLRKIRGEHGSRDLLSSFLLNFVVLDTAGKDCLWALRSDLPDLEDATQLETAARASLDCIITRDRHGFAKSNIPVCTPEQYLHQHKNRSV